eukprot:4658977-Prymnesium_polylepis.1
MGGWVPRSVGGHARAREGWGVPAAPSVLAGEGAAAAQSSVHVSDVRAAAGGFAAPVSRAPPAATPRPLALRWTRRRVSSPRARRRRTSSSSAPRPSCCAAPT